MLRSRALASLRWFSGPILFFTIVALMSAVAAQAQEPAETPPAATTEAPAEPAAEAPAETAESTEEAPAPPTVEQLAYAIDNLVLLFAAVLVISMQAGFALVESGLNSGKNAVNIMYKNVFDFCVGVALYWLIGYGMMYPGDAWKYGKLFGFAGIGVASGGVTAAPGALTPQVDFLFQAAFAATAATIVSGAVAGRIKFSSYIIYSIIITGLIYPISGSWQWGKGWLYDKEFHDFAGSILVHAVGGFAGLAGAIVLGPRKGRFSAEGKPIPMPGHNIPFAALGVFILWIGWYGFNPGSQLAFTGQQNTDDTMLIATNTTLAAAFGGIVATFLSWGTFGKPDLTMALNGVLAGLVGITANCNCVTNGEAIGIGAVAGALVMASIVLLDKLRIDDPVGAFPVHGVCGIWGGIATGIFGEGKDLTVQLIGTGAVCAWAFFTMLGVFLLMKAAGHLRVTEEEEIKGLDITEHGMEAYTHA